MFLGKGVLEICSKFTGEYPCRSVISIKLQSNFIEIKLRNECSPVNLLHISGAAFPKNIYGWLLLTFSCEFSDQQMFLRTSENVPQHQTTGFLYLGRKRHLIILTQGSCRLYPSDNTLLKVAYSI